MIRSTLLFAGLSLGLGLAQAATEVLPTSYTLDQATSCGTYCYHDGGQELTDGRYGVAGWAADLGNGPAAEWVGWSGQPIVNIDFSFAGPVAVDTVAFGTTQNRVDDVVLPSLEVFAWVAGAWQSVGTLNTPEDSARDVDPSNTSAHGFLTLSGLGIRVQARFSSDGPWTFVDEVDFYAPVPEASAGGMALASLPLVWAASRCRKRRHS